MIAKGGFLMITKKELRKVLIEKRKHLSSEYRQQADALIFQNVIKSEAYQNSQTIFCFVSTTDEVNTYPILNHALNQRKCVVVPKCLEKGIMQAYQILSFDDLESGKYGIQEPKEHCKSIPPSDIDLAIIPCLSCNSEGYRIGYGGGFYDRYLQNQTFAKISICYRELLCENIPIESFDEKTDIIISD